MRRKADLLAATIEEEIADQQLPVGHMLGSEPELCERYKVGRSVFREAVRLLEHHHVATMRQGRGGGLVVAEPHPSTVARGAALLLRRSGVGPLDLVEARGALETTCAGLAAARIDRADHAELLREQLAREADADAGDLRDYAADFHYLVARLTENPVLALYTRILVDLTRQRIAPPDSPDQAHGDIVRAHRRVGEAILGGDVQMAQNRMSRHFDGMISGWKRQEPDLYTFNAPMFGSQHEGEEFRAH